jgi:hypothetical protein
MKKIISYSIWGDSPMYLDGALNNIRLADKFYPGWTVRFYYQDNMPSKLLLQLKNAGAELKPKPFYRDAWFGLYWRFCPMYDDRDIERFIVRDTDAKISAREADAVQQWIESKKPFHIMRDNREHNIEILGGMWGAVPGCVPDFAVNIRRWMQTVHGDTKNPRGRFHGTDQDFLKVFVWPYIKDNHIAHGIKYYKNEIPFRVENPDGYKVGT